MIWKGFSKVGILLGKISAATLADNNYISSPDTWEGSLLSAWNVCGTWERGNSVHTCSFPYCLITGSPLDGFVCMCVFVLIHIDLATTHSWFLNLKI